MENLYTRLRKAEPADGRNEDSKVFPSSNGPVEYGNGCVPPVEYPEWAKQLVADLAGKQVVAAAAAEQENA